MKCGARLLERGNIEEAFGIYTESSLDGWNHSSMPQSCCETQTLATWNWKRQRNNCLRVINHLSAGCKSPRQITWNTLQRTSLLTFRSAARPKTSVNYAINHCMHAAFPLTFLTDLICSSPGIPAQVSVRELLLLLLPSSTWSASTIDTSVILKLMTLELSLWHSVIAKDH